MECGLCNEVRDLQIDCKIKLYKVCYWEKSDNKDDETLLSNNVLYFLHDAEEKAAYKVIVETCESKFAEKDIKEAKQYILAKVGDKLSQYDNELYKSVSKPRQDSKNRTAITAILDDLVQILRAMDGQSDGKLRVRPENIQKIPHLKLESTVLEALVTRVEDVEARLVNAEETITVLKVENADLKDKLAKSATPGTTTLVPVEAAAGPSSLANIPDTATATAAKTKLTGAQRHLMNIAASDAAADAAAHAIQSGLSLDVAKNMGKIAANATAKTYALSLKGNNGSGTTSPQPTAPLPLSTPAGPPSLVPAATPHPWTTVKNKGKLAKISPYKTGTKATSGTSLIPKKPDYLANKCLVISGLSTEIDTVVFKSYIESQVGKDINLLNVQPLSREGSSWLTLAIELSEDDYNLLSNPDIWEPQIRIRDFKGWRFWRSQTQQRPNREELRNSVRMSWS